MSWETDWKMRGMGKEGNGTKRVWQWGGKGGNGEMGGKEEKREREMGGEKDGRRLLDAAAVPLSVSSAPSPPIGRAPPLYRNILVLLGEPVVHQPPQRAG